MAHYISVLTAHRFDYRETSQPRVLIVNMAEWAAMPLKGVHQGSLAVSSQTIHKSQSKKYGFSEEYGFSPDTVVNLF